MGLDVDEVRAEHGLRAVDGQLLRDVDELAAPVVAPAGIALRVLVRQDRPLRLQDGAGDEVLRRDHLERPALAGELVIQHGADLGVELRQGHVIEGIAHGLSPDQVHSPVSRVEPRPRRAAAASDRSLPGGPPPVRQSRLRPA
jgi:hypothetical protein